MAREPKIPGPMKVTNVNLVLGPKGISLDEAGRIQFQDPDIEQVVLSGAPEGLGPDETQAFDINFSCNNNCKKN